MVMISLLSCSVLRAHVTNHATYTFYKIEKKWNLLITFQTSNIVKVITKYNPELRGVNLNNEAFKNATYAYVQKNLIINNANVLLKPISAIFDGHKVNLKFSYQTDNTNELLTVKNTCFVPGNGHLSNELIIMSNGKEYIKFLDQDITAISFNLKTNRFISEQGLNNISSYSNINIILCGLFLVLVSLFFFKS